MEQSGLVFSKSSINNKNSLKTHRFLSIDVGYIGMALVIGEQSEMEQMNPCKEDVPISKIVPLQEKKRTRYSGHSVYFTRRHFQIKSMHMLPIRDGTHYSMTKKMTKLLHHWYLNNPQSIKKYPVKCINVECQGMSRPKIKTMFSTVVTFFETLKLVEHHTYKIHAVHPASTWSKIRKCMAHKIPDFRLGHSANKVSVVYVAKYLLRSLHPEYLEHLNFFGEHAHHICDAIVQTFYFE
jgi:hypothetical protein